MYDQRVWFGMVDPHGTVQTIKKHFYSPLEVFQPCLDIDGEFLVRLSTNSSRPREAVGTVEGHDGINT